jgi:hypothetical protein
MAGGVKMLTVPTTALNTPNSQPCCSMATFYAMNMAMTQKIGQRDAIQHIFLFEQLALRYDAVPYLLF